MTVSDKDRADMLLGVCEDLFIRCCALQALLDEAKLADWPRRLDMTISSDLASQIRVEFREIYQQALEQVDQSRMLELLKKMTVPEKLQ